MKKILATLVLAVLASSVSQALMYNVNTQGSFQGVFEGNTPAASIGSSLFVYKDDNGGGETGATGSFTTAYSGDDDQTAKIIIDSGIWDLDYLAIKVSNKYALWALVGWNPGVYDSLIVENAGIITNNKGKSQAISHVSLYGGETVQVPDTGATLALLGLALTGLAVVRRRAGR